MSIPEIQLEPEVYEAVRKEIAYGERSSSALYRIASRIDATVEMLTLSQFHDRVVSPIYKTNPMLSDYEPEAKVEHKGRERIFGGTTVKELRMTKKKEDKNGAEDEWNCPYCNRKAFASERGLNIHIGHMHSVEADRQTAESDTPKTVAQVKNEKKVEERANLRDEVRYILISFAKASRDNADPLDVVEELEAHIDQMAELVDRWTHG